MIHRGLLIWVGTGIFIKLTPRRHFGDESIKFGLCTVTNGARGIVVVKALCYKPEGRAIPDKVNF
jgi:hypothetical protein